MLGIQKKELRSFLDHYDVASNIGKFCHLPLTYISEEDIVSFRYFSPGELNQPLSSKTEIDFIKKYFRYDTSSFKHLAPGTAFIYTDESKALDICKKAYSCEKEHTYIQDLFHKIAPDCGLQKGIALHYNCIGYALGILESIYPEDLKIYSSNSLKKISKTLTKLKEKSKKSVFSEDFQKGKLTVLSIDKLKEPHDGDMVLYFKENELQHAARYVEKINDEPVNCWSSKLGPYPVYCHDIYHIEGNTYGKAAFYVTFVGPSDEL